MSRPQYLLWLPLGLLLFLEFNFAQELPPPEVGPNGRDGEDIGSIQDDVNELRIQFYVVAGIAGGLFLLLILLVLAIALSISRIKDQLQHKDRRYIPQETVNTRISRQPEPVNAYINSAFNGAHEMEERSVDAKTEINRLGYDVYNGRSSNVAAETPRQDQRNDKHHLLRGQNLRYVSPYLHEGDGSTRRKQLSDASENEDDDVRDRYPSRVERFVQRNGHVIQTGAMFKKPSLRSGASEIPRAKVGERSRDYGNDQDHRRHLRLEDGVTPIGSRNGKNHGERRPERERY